MGFTPKDLWNVKYKKINLSTFAAYTAAKCQALYQRTASEGQAALMYKDMALLRLRSRKRKMNLPFQALFSHVHILGQFPLVLLQCRDGSGRHKTQTCHSNVSNY